MADDDKRSRDAPAPGAATSRATPEHLADSLRSDARDELARQLIASPDRSSTLLRLFEQQRTFILDIIAENARLRDEVATHIAADSDVSQLREENERLRRQLRDAFEDAVLLQDRLSALKGSRVVAESEGELFRTRYEDLERTSASLVNLYVSLQQIQMAESVKELLATLGEVIVNFVGCEEFVVALLNAGTGKFETVLQADTPATVLELETVRACIGSGQVKLCDPEVEKIAGAVPLLLGERCVGVIVLTSLLPHKGDFVDLDRELMALLANRFASVLSGLRLREQLGDIEQVVGTVFGDWSNERDHG